jgi:hydrogenase maturation protease
LTEKEHKQNESLKILIYGYGNPGRQDDGLGNLFVEKAKQWAQSEGLDYITFDSNYQLNIEDAAEIAGKDIVVFVDASIEDIEEFELTPITPGSKVEFSMHSVSPAFVVKLCQDIYPEIPKAYLLHLKGYRWEFMEGITQKALQNMEAAFEFMKPLLRSPKSLLNYENEK